MELEEKEKIKRFAQGDQSLGKESINIFRKYLGPKHLSGKLGPQETPEMAFMSEIDNPSPCYIMRRIYRNRLLGKPDYE